MVPLKFDSQGLAISIVILPATQASSDLLCTIECLKVFPQILGLTELAFLQDFEEGKSSRCFIQHEHIHEWGGRPQAFRSAVASHQPPSNGQLAAPRRQQYGAFLFRAMHLSWLLAT